MVHIMDLQRQLSPASFNVRTFDHLFSEEEKDMKTKSLFLALSIFLCGCAASDGPAPAQTEFSKMPLSEKFSMYSSESSAMRMSADSLVHHAYADNQEIADDSTDIIVGVITEILPECHNGFIGSYCTVEVQEVLRGDLKPGDVIRISKLQGVATASQMAESFDNEDDMKKLLGKTAEDEDTLFINKPVNDLLTDIGQKSLYFLKKSDVEEGRYRLTSGPSSEFLALENGRYVSVVEVAQSIGGQYLTEESVEKMNQMEWEKSIDSSDFAEQTEEE